MRRSRACLHGAIEAQEAVDRRPAAALKDGSRSTGAASDRCNVDGDLGQIAAMRYPTPGSAVIRPASEPSVSAASSLRRIWLT